MAKQRNNTRKAGNDMRSKSIRLFTAIVAVAVLMSVLSACGLMGGNGSGGGLGDVVVVGDGSSAPGVKPPTGFTSGEDVDYGAVDPNDGGERAQNYPSDALPSQPMESQPQQPIGSVDSRLYENGISWQHENTSTRAWHEYVFHADGTFEYARVYNGYATEATGYYMTSGDKVYLYDIEYRSDVGIQDLREQGILEERIQIAEIEFEYQVGSDQNGNFLMIPFIFEAVHTPDDEYSMVTRRFRRLNTDGRFD